MNTQTVGNTHVTPAIVEDDRKRMTKPKYDLILGCNTMKELGITIDEIVLPMRNTNSLASTKIEKAWAVNNSRHKNP